VLCCSHFFLHSGFPVLTNRPRNILSIDLILRALGIVLLVLACIKVISPFFAPLTWAAIIAVSTWPAFRWLRGRLGGRAVLASSLLIAALGAALIVPLALLVLSLADAVPQVLTLVSDLANMKLPGPPLWLRGIPLLGPALTDAWQSSHTDIASVFGKLKPYLDQSAYWALGQGAQLGKNLLVLVLALIVSGVFLVYGDAAWDTFGRILARVGGRLGGHLPELMARTIRSVTNGVVGTALVQGLLILLGLLIAGVPGAVILGFLCFLLAVAQLPTMLLWIPAAIWLFYAGHTGYAVFLAVWGMVLVNLVENVLKPYLISHGSGLPLPLIFLGVIGGLLSWGLVGLFIGPTALAVGHTLFNFWLSRDMQAEEECPPAPHEKDAIGTDPGLKNH
jgi:predicted PurR-regulated permease PerM